MTTHEDGTAIERSANNEKIKLVDGTELNADALTYFDTNKDKMKKKECR